MPRRGNKPIVYLDQNWISEITKAHIEGWTGTHKPYVSQLSLAIQGGVAEDNFVCPTSDFHDTEASFSQKLKDSIWKTSRALSRDLSFNSWIQVNHKQLVEAALGFAGQDIPDSPWWYVPFNRDPDIPARSLPIHHIRVHLSVEVYMEEVKRIRDGIQTSDYRKFKENRKKEGLSYEDELAYGITQLFREHHVGPIVAISQGRFKLSEWESLFHSVALQAVNRYKELETIFQQGGGLDKFLVSPHLANSPLLSICAKLRAADIVRFPSRKPEPSLIDDFQIAATILPYVDIFATENYLAELIKQTGLDREYNCRVYRMKQKEDLLNELQGM